MVNNGLSLEEVAYLRSLLRKAERELVTMRHVIDSALNRIPCTCATRDRLTEPCWYCDTLRTLDKGRSHA